MIHLYVLYSLGIIVTHVLWRQNFVFYAFLTFFSSLLITLYRILNHHKKLAIHIFLIFIIFVFYSWSVAKIIYFKENSYESGFVYQESQEYFQGRIEEFPRYKYSSNQYILKDNNSLTNFIFYTEPYQKFLYLEKIKVKGKILDARESGEWSDYYQKNGINYLINKPQVTSIGLSKPRNIKENFFYYLYSWKSFLREITIKKFSSYTSALVLGIMLGEKDELSKEEKQVFNNANLSHILVVSGYNISIIISFIFFILQPFSKYIRIVSSLVCIFIFVSLVGYEASVIRAALMGSIVVWARIFRRKKSAVNVLFVVSFIMILTNPDIIYDVGFHLSFLATYSLLFYPDFKKIPEYVGSTVWVFIFISPYIIHLSGSFSLIGIFTNLSVLFVIPFFMFISLFSLIFSIINLNIGIDLFVLDIISRYIYFVANFSSSIPRIPLEISPVIVVLFYSAIISVVSFLDNRYTTEQFINKHYLNSVQQKTN